MKPEVTTMTEGISIKILIPRAEELDKTNNGKTIEGEYVLHYKRIKGSRKRMYLKLDGISSGSHERGTAAANAQMATKE